MSYTVKEISFPSADNTHTLKGTMYIPNGEIKGVLQVVHGMTEYTGRYEPFFEFIANKGYIAFGYDNLGHGKTVNDKSELGFIASKDGYRLLVDDVVNVAKTVKAQYNDLPFILMGHSMGSFLVRLAAVRLNGVISKLIVCGTAGTNPVAGVGIALLRLVKLVSGAKSKSEFCDGLMFGGYNKHFEGSSKSRWLSTDKDEVAAYDNDELCNYSFTVSALLDLTMLATLCNKKEWYENLDKSFPILLIAGGDDPVGEYGKKVREVERRLNNTGHSVKTVIYEGCRHEILNDIKKDDVMADIASFLDNSAL